MSFSEKELEEKILKKIRNVPNFPQRGIQFKDISTLVKDVDGLKDSVNFLYEKYRDKGITKVAAIEARGYIFGGALAIKMDAGFVMMRKPGKLPYKTLSETYELEYGTDSIEMHVDGIEKGDKVLIFDDLLATGGTAKAACNLVERAGGKVAGVGFVIELTGSLHGRDKLVGYDVFSLVKIPVEE
ncbi:MAG: adenine phosphoribosyltransferase [Candidatus Lokiarchaeota archaeon]|nr:adenine phosphoribosyltransferase [Candidatus Lokiarchaeota archaeon]